MDSDQALNVLIKLGFVGSEQAEAAKEALAGVKAESDGVKESTSDLNKEMEYVPESLKGIAGAADDEKHKISLAREEHTALHHIMGELTKIAPGLGTAFDFLSAGFVKAGESAAEGAGGLEAFNAALATTMAEILPLLVAVLTIEAATKLWEDHKKTVEATAKAQADACQKMVESTQKVIDAMTKMNEMLHPTKTTAEKDEDDLKKKIDAIKAQAAIQKELDAADEKKELAAATNDHQKAAIKDKYKEKGIREDEVTAFDIVGVQTTAAAIAKKQIAAIEAEIAQRKANLEQGNEDERVHMQGGTPEEKAHGEDVIAGRNNAFAILLDQKQKEAGNLSPTADKFDSDATEGSEAARKKYTTDVEVHKKEQYAAQENSLLNAQTGSHETLKQLLDATGKSHEQTEAILQMIITKHLTLTATMAMLQAQLNNTQTLGGA